MATSYADYKRHIRALLTEYGRQGILVGGVPVRFSPLVGVSPDDGGIIRARDPHLTFRDGARLTIYEKVQVIDQEVQRLKYTYHYERPNGYFFRYEREESDDLIRKPEYHLHVVLNLPHFNAPPVNLEIILRLIAANFYSPDLYTRQIIGQEIHVTV